MPASLSSRGAAPFGRVSGHVTASALRFLGEAGTAAEEFVVAAGLVSEAWDAPKHPVKSRSTTDAKAIR
jgi:hypothetical protein